MAEQELQIVHLKDDFYRDGFYKVILTFLTVLTAVAFLITVSVLLFLIKPIPVQFITAEEWRVLPPVPLDKPYLHAGDLLQWVSSVLPNMFIFDFVDYRERMDKNTQYFTENGWKQYSNVMNGFANVNTIQADKMFITAVPYGAPFVLNQGLLSGKYAWWIQMPLTLTYVNLQKTYDQNIQVQVLVVRVPTLNNLEGVSIDNIIVTKT